MKRIYLTGAAVLLLLILGITYSVNYFSKKPAQNTTQDGTAAPVAASGTATLPAPIDNSANVQDNTIVPQPENESTENAYRPRRTRKYVARSSRKAHEVVNEKLVSYASNDNDQNNTAVEKTKDYFGNNPQPAPRTKTVVRVRKANNESETRHGFLRGNFGVGPEIGFNQNGVTNAPGNIQTGSINVGLRANINMSHTVAFQPGLLYINRGTKYINNMDPNINEKLSMHYLEVPADFVFKFGNPQDTRFMVGAGPYVAYLLGAKDKFNSDYAGYTDIAPQGAYNTSSIPQVDYGIDGFVGLTTPEGIYAKAGGQLGMQNIQNNASYGNTGGMRNYSVMVSVGYILGGNKQ